MAPPVFGILGEVVVRGSSEQVHVGGRRRRGLLGLLLVNAGGHVSLDRLCDDLWDGRPTSGAAGTVRTYVAQFRRLDVPGAGLALRPEGGGYTVHVERQDLDATTFEDLLSDGRALDARGRLRRLEEALALWRGPALVEFQGSHWADQASRRLDLLRLQAVQERFESMIDLGEHVLCLPELEATVDSRPFDERLRELLALARYRSGRIDAALRALSELRRELVEQLGILPGPRIAALEARILDRDPTLDHTAPTTVAPITVAPIADAPLASRRPMPTGTVTFLFTDIEGSTSLLAKLGDERYGEVLRDHRELIGRPVDEQGGVIFGREGDSVFVAFAGAAEAVAAAGAAQRALHLHRWDDDVELRVRMGLHAGEALVLDEDYVGSTVHVAARIAAAGHGGQVVASAAVTALAPTAAWHDLGLHQLEGVERPEHLYQLDIPDVPSQFPPMRTSQRAPSSLPLPLDAFIGRERELTETAEVLDASRLVTLVGPGGVGKTRLSVEVGRGLSGRFPGGVHFVDLATVGSDDEVERTIAESIPVRQRSGVDLAEAVAMALGDRPALLVIDNCEHVLDGVVAPTSALLTRCSELRILATSREPLQLRGERTILVEPLDTEGRDGDRSAAERLFLDRATAATSRADAVADDRLVRQLCTDLDGLPLAIELAASRLRSLALVDMVGRLDDRFQLLRSASRRVLERHQTLEAVVAWSHEALPPVDRALFNRLSVFGDSFTSELAEAVVPDDRIDVTEVLDGLSRLVDKSLVRLVVDHGVARYRLLETLRQYGRARLVETGDLGALEDRLVAWGISIAAGLERDMRTERQDASLQSALAERGNLRTALALSLERGDALGALRIVASVPVGTPEERLALIGRLLPQVGDAHPDVAARARLAGANLAFERGDYEDGVDHARRAAELFRTRRDRRSVAWSSFLEAFCAWGTGRIDQARAAIAFALAEFRELDEPLGVANASWAAVLLASDAEQADALCAVAEDQLRQIGSAFALAHCLEASALTRLRLERMDGVRERLGEALQVFSNAGNEGCTAHCLETIGAAVVSETAAPEVVAELLGGAERLRLISGHTHRPWELGGHQAAMAALAGRLDGAVLHQAVQRGHRHDFRSATELGLRVLADAGESGGSPVDLPSNTSAHAGPRAQLPLGSRRGRGRP